MKHWFVIVSLFAVMITSCTDADLCPDPLDQHPHSLAVSFSFNWDRDPEHSSTLTSRDSMYIIAYRVINMWKSTVAVSSLGTPVKGHYIHSDFAMNQPSEEQSTEGEQSTEETKPANPEVDRFLLKSGDYKFITFNRNDSEIDYTSVNNYLQNDEIPLSELNVIYKTYRKDDPNLRFTIPDWVDFNAYGDPDRYMQPSVQAIYYDTIPVQRLRVNNIGKNAVRPIRFSTPRRLTQRITIEFDIKKVVNNTPFVVDSVFAEIAGIPYIINLASGSIDITKTKKMMFKTSFPSDTETNSSIHCTGTIDVPTIIESASDDLFMGPGIMQVMIMSSAVDTLTGDTLHKTFQGSINLYKTLTKAELIKWSEDKQTVTKNKDFETLTIQAEMLINGESIIENPDDNSGLDVWRKEDRNPNIVDI